MDLSKRSGYYEDIAFLLRCLTGDIQIPKGHSSFNLEKTESKVSFFLRVAPPLLLRPPYINRASGKNL
jgi:hypothetical protein